LAKAFWPVTGLFYQENMDVYTLEQWLAGVTKKGLGLGPTPEFFLAGTTRLELATSGVTGRRV
jgi:hypothetical protein